MKYDTQIDLSVLNNSHTQIIRRIPENSKVLELGCATGYMSKHLSESLGCSVTGVDIDEESVKVAKEYCSRVLVANVEHTDWIESFGEEKFDVITCADIIEHLVKPASFLENVKPLLNDDGVLLASLPNGAHASLRLELLEGRFTYQDTGLLDRTHLHLFTHKSIRTLFSRSGYRVEDLSYTFHDMANDVIVERLGRLGLDVTEKALSHFHTPEASAYQFILTASPSIDNETSTIPELTDKPLRDSVEVYDNLLVELHEAREVSDARAQVIEANNVKIMHLENTVNADAKIIEARDKVIDVRDKAIDTIKKDRQLLNERLKQQNEELNSALQMYESAQRGNEILNNNIKMMQKTEHQLRVQLDKHSKALRGIIDSNGWRVFQRIMAPIGHVKKLFTLLKYLIKNPKVVPSWINRAKLLWQEGGAKAVFQYISDDKRVDRVAPARSYAKWIELKEERLEDDKEHVISFLEEGHNYPTISIVMPVYNVDKIWLVEALESVIRQTYPYWQLCVVDDASTDKLVRSTLEHYQKRDSRIKVIFREKNGHISVASNDGIEMASGDYIGFMDHDDVITTNALYHVAKTIIQNPNAKMVYSDEDKLDSDGTRFSHYFKPDFNHDLMLSHNMICHFGVYEKSLVNELGGFNADFDGAQDYDFALRCIGKLDEGEILHIPRILYHWRAIPESTASNGEVKPYAIQSAIRAVESYLSSRNIAATVTENPNIEGMLRVKYELPKVLPLVSIIIPTRNGLDILSQCIDSIVKKTTYKNYEIIVVDNSSDDKETLDYLESLSQNETAKIIRYDKPFNYSAINNYAVTFAKGEVLAFLNNDIEVITEEWLSEMVSHSLRDEIGAVGARLWYPNDTLQHGGVILGLGGVAGHAMKSFSKENKGYNARAVLVQNYSAVTAACMVMRKSIFEEVGGFEEDALPVAFNDVDLCLKVREAGYRNLWTPFAELYHHESISRGAEDTKEKQRRFTKEKNYMVYRWGEFLSNDPAYNPNLTLNREDFTLRW